MQLFSMPFNHAFVAQVAFISAKALEAEVADPQLRQLKAECGEAWAASNRSAKAAGDGLVDPTLLRAAYRAEAALLAHTNTRRS